MVDPMQRQIFEEIAKYESPIKEEMM